MTSQEGVIWCWKDNVDNILFIFRDNYQEIEINLNYIMSEMWFIRNTKLLLPHEKNFLKTIISKGVN